MDIIGEGVVILSTAVASSRGLSGSVDAQVLLELNQQWRKGQGNPGLVRAMRLCHQILHDEGP